MNGERLQAAERAADGYLASTLPAGESTPRELVDRLLATDPAVLQRLDQSGRRRVAAALIQLLIARLIVAGAYADTAALRHTIELLDGPADGTSSAEPPFRPDSPAESPGHLSPWSAAD